MAEIKCPHCNQLFEPNEAIREEIEKELRTKAADWQKKKNEELMEKDHADSPKYLKDLFNASFHKVEVDYFNHRNYGE